MTLAEVFLLLVFVVWVGQTRAASPDPAISIILQEEQELRDKLNALEAQLIEQTKKDEELEAKVKFWEDNYNMDIPGTQKEITDFVKQYLAQQGPGHPPCQQNNVLVQVALINGQAQMKFVTESPPLAQFLNAEGIKDLKVGNAVTDASQIEAILRAVSNYYKAKSAEKHDCRFDYRLSYGTNDDYHDGRVRFEGYFYPAGITKAAQ